jgi:hypothetical protein
MFVNFNILNQLGSPAINSNTFANRPAAGQTGRLFVSTDTFEIYRDNGTTWDLIGGPGSSTITGTGTATQVAYFTSSQAIGSSANLFWDNTNGFLGVATAVPTARIEAVKTDGYGIYANYTTVAGSGSSASAIYAINTTASSGYAAVIEERTGNTTGGQYPLLVKHSLSSGTAAVGNGTGLQFQLQDDAGTFKTTQLTIETTDAAAATYKSRYRFNVQNNGSSTPVAYINATGLGLFTATPGAALDIHSTGIMAQLNSTSATANSLLAFQRSGSGLWRIGDNYNSGTNFFELYNTVLSTNAIAVLAATNKTEFTAVETYSTGLARANYFDYNLSVAAGGSFSSPNAITALGASLDLSLAGSATIPSGSRSGLDAYNSVSFTGTGTLTQSQGTQIRAYSNLTTGWAFNGSATGTITHLAGLRVLFPDNTGSAVTVTNNYGLLINDQTANTGTVTFTNRWGIYQEGASDLNYFAANTLIGTTVNTGDKLVVNGRGSFSDLTQGLKIGAFTGGSGFGAIYPYTVTPSNTNHSFAASSSATILNVAIGGVIDLEINTASALYIDTNKNVGIGTITPVANTPLTLQGASGYTDLLWLKSVGSNIDSRINFAPTGTGITQLNNTTGTAIALQIAGAEKMRLDSAGNLGLGTSTPACLIDATQSSSAGNVIMIMTNTSANAYSGTLFRSSSLTDKGFIGWANASTSAWASSLALFGIGPDPLVFGTSNTERARFTAGGNFLIGTTTDSGYKLDVVGRIVSNNFAGVEAVIWGKGGADAVGQGKGNFRTSDAGGTNYWDFGRDNLTTGDFVISEYGTTVTRIKTSTGKFETTNSIKTGAPTTGTAAEWKLGSRVAAAVALDTTQYIEVDIGGTLYKLAIVT